MGLPIPFCFNGSACGAVVYGTVGAIHESPALLLVILSEGAQRKKQACFYSLPASPVVILSEGAHRKKEYHARIASDRVEGPLSGAGSNELLSRG